MIMINMMAKTLLYCLFIPVTLLAALCSDIGISSKFVCIGNTVQVFQNITSPNYELEIILYKTFTGKDETIAAWSMQNISDKDIHDKYKKKVSLENGTILIRDFQKSDEATYVMLYDMTKRTEIQLCAVAPPTKRCKADIRQEEHFLITSLDDPEYCGTPRASVHWMEYPDILPISKTVIELPPGTEARTYRACIEGEALKCMKDSAEWNNCKNYTIRSIQGNESPTSPTPLSDIPQIKTYGIVTIVLLVLLIVGVILYILLRQFGLVPTRTEGERRHRQMKHQQLLQAENDVGFGKVPIRTERERRQRQMKHQQLPQVEYAFDSEYEMNEVGTNHQSGIDPDTVRELQELRDAARCKICFANKASVFFMPCNHVATCDECSTSLNICPVCRAPIRDRRKIRFDSDK